MERLTNRIIYLGVVAVLLLSAQLSFACPNIEGFVDYNCDGKLKIVLTGDSIVAGAGDKQIKGGYPSRLRQSLGVAQVVNLGFNGIKTSQLTALFENAFSGSANSFMAKAAKSADVIVLDVGRNDYHTGASPQGTVNRIKALHSLLKRKSNKTATIVVSTLIPTARVEQGAWVRSLNRSLLSQKSKRFPVLMRFDSFPERLLSSDQLHPGSSGYARLAQIVERTLKKKVSRKQLHSRRDKDLDGVYDIFEKTKFGTDPHSSDTDADGLLDGEELFEISSDPLDPLSPGSASALQFFNRLSPRW